MFSWARSGRGKGKKYFNLVEETTRRGATVAWLNMWDILKTNYQQANNSVRNSNCPNYNRQLDILFVLFCQLWPRARRGERRWRRPELCITNWFDSIFLNQRWSQRTGFGAANRFIGEVVQSRRRPLLGPSPGWMWLLPLSHLRHY